MKMRIRKPKHKFDTNKKAEFKVVGYYFQEDTKDCLQLAASGWEVCEVSNRGKENYIDAMYLPTEVYEDLLIEFKDSFSRQEKVIGRRKSKEHTCNT